MEGVRAVLIDKDKAPRWNPSRVEDVTEEMVAAFFVDPWAGTLHPFANLEAEGQIDGLRAPQKFDPHPVAQRHGTGTHEVSGPCSFLPSVEYADAKQQRDDLRPGEAADKNVLGYESGDSHRRGLLRWRRRLTLRLTTLR